MNDQLLMENYLLVLKSTVEVFVHGTLESSNTDVRNILKHALDEIMNAQNRTFHHLVNMGCYQVQNIPSTPILETFNKLTKGN